MIEDDKPYSFWQLVFTQSKANGARHFGDYLSTQSWEWPRDTFLQRRLRELREQDKDND